MSLTLYYHPLASFCWKALLALYEAGIPFEKILVDLSEPASRAAFVEVWPLARFPVLKDAAREALVPESTIIVEYLALHEPGAARLLPAGPEASWKARLWDRFYDHYVHEPMQRIVFDKLRGPGKSDSAAVEQARATLDTAYSMLERDLSGKHWAMGDSFTLADCSAFPALFYADMQHPLDARHGNVRRYLDRLQLRPSVVRVLEEAQPYMQNVPR